MARYGAQKWGGALEIHGAALVRPRYALNSERVLWPPRDDHAQVDHAAALHCSSSSSHPPPAPYYLGDSTQRAPGSRGGGRPRRPPVALPPSWWSRGPNGPAILPQESLPPQLCLSITDCAEPSRTRQGVGAKLQLRPAYSLPALAVASVFGLPAPAAERLLGARHVQATPRHGARGFSPSDRVEQRLRTVGG